jgi:hypothetical protein
MKTVACLSFGLVMFGSILLQEYPALTAIDISCLVTFENHDSMFIYSYGLRNHARNKGSIIRFEVDVSRSPNSIPLDTAGLKFGGSALTERWFREDFPGLQGKIVPVSFLGTPGRMTGSFSNALTAVWDGYPLIQPGEGVGGFKLMSRGLPTTRRCVASPRFDIDSLFPDIEDTNRTLTITQMDSIQEAVNYHGWTIGPTAPPLNFNATIWIDTLLSYTRQSVALGWLGREKDDDCDNDEHPQDGIERNIEHRLTMAQRELQDGDSVKARRDLQMLVNKVDRIWKRGQIVEKKHEHDRGDWWQHRKDWVVMTSEAYALLKYNIEYLIDKLPERERHEGKPGDDKKQR